MTNMYVRNQFFMNPENRGNKVKTLQGVTSESIVEDIKNNTSIVYTDYSIIEVLSTWLRTSDFTLRQSGKLWTVGQLFRYCMGETDKKRQRVYEMLTSDRILKKIEMYLPVVKSSKRDFIFGDFWYSESKVKENDIKLAIALGTCVHPFMHDYIRRYQHYGCANFIDVDRDSLKVLAKIDFPVTSIRNLLFSLGILYTDASACVNMDVYVSMVGENVLVWPQDQTAPRMLMPYSRFVMLYEQDILNRIDYTNFRDMQITEYVGVTN